MNWVLLKNSVLMSSLATLLSVGFGMAAALWMAGLTSRARGWVWAIAIVTFALPPFLVANCWLHYLGPAGSWRGWLPLNIMSLGGTVWILALLNWPVTLLLAGGAWNGIEAAQLESDPAARGWRLITGVLLPYAKGALLQALVITFVLALNNFAVPSIMQVKVLPAEMWVKFNTALDSAGALRMSWPLIAAPLIVIALCWRQGVRWPWLRSAGPALVKRQLGAVWFRGCGVFTIVLGLISVGVPLYQVGSLQRTWTELPGAVAAGQSAIWNSVLLAAAGATSVAVLAVGTGMRPSSRAGGSVGQMLQGFLWLPFLVPGVATGIVLILLFNRPSMYLLYRSAAIVVLAFVIRYGAIGWHLVKLALRRVDTDLMDLARVEGLSHWQMMRHTIWPEVAPLVAAGWYIVFVFCLWDVESIVMILPPGRETLAVRVFNLLHYGYNPEVNALCLTLVAVAAAPLLIWKVATAAQRRGLSGPVVVGAVIALVLPLMTGCGRVSETNSGAMNSRIFQRVECIGSRGVGVGELNKPRSVAVDREDNLFVVDMTGRVQKFSREGKFVLSWQMPQTDLGKPKGMCLDPEGGIVVVEPHYQRVNHFTSDGKLVAQWGSTGTNIGEFKLPRAVGINSLGELFVSEYGVVDRVQRFTLDRQQKKAKLLNSFGHAGTGPGEFNRPEGLCVDKQDLVHVADSCNHRIQIFSSDGKFIRSYGKAGAGPGELSYPYDICVDKGGRQYVCEFGNSRIQVFDAMDRPVEIIGGPGAEPGKFSNPWGVALDSLGNLYVADSQNHRVQKFVRRTDVASSRLSGEVVARRTR
jgi:ABC-type Fe3+ transport system permease subunit/DNA-binding beta-propeller fold protein YncE